jgi:hypothetical protein
MTVRTIIHAIAASAALILMFATRSPKESSSVIVRAIALLILVVYLIWVFAVIVHDIVRRPPSYNGELWDGEVDGRPRLDQPDLEWTIDPDSPADLD